MPSAKTPAAVTITEFDRVRAEKILDTIRRSLRIRNEDFASLLIAQENRDPFRVLVVTILSQNCTDVAAIRAYRRLDEQVGVEPDSLKEARIRTIRRAIRVAGLYKPKARAIKQIARVISGEYEGDLTELMQGSVEAARDRLQELPNVGPKTADVLLSVWDRPTISVDTHVDRVAKRLGFARAKARYEEVRASLMQAYPSREYTRVPLAFMALGRAICKARKPLCPSCPVESFCPYPNKTQRTKTDSRSPVPQRAA